MREDDRRSTEHTGLLEAVDKYRSTSGTGSNECLLFLSFLQTNQNISSKFFVLDLAMP